MEKQQKSNMVAEYNLQKKLLMIPIQIRNSIEQVVVDIGATSSFISRDLFRKHNLETSKLNPRFVIFSDGQKKLIN